MLLSSNLQFSGFLLPFRWVKYLTIEMLSHLQIIDFRLMMQVVRQQYRSHSSRAVMRARHLHVCRDIVYEKCPKVRVELQRDWRIHMYLRTQVPPSQLPLHAFRARLRRGC